MRRFITYLYEYENGQKTKNTGFIRVDERNGKVVFQINVRNFIRSQEKGEIYAFVWENGLQGIIIGEFQILNNQSDIRVELDTENIKNSGHSLNHVIGIGLAFPNNGYMASCWDDDYAEVIGSGRFRIWREGATQQEKEHGESYEENIVEIQRAVEQEGLLKPEDHVVQQEVVISEKEIQPLQAASYELVTYQKMELNAIKSLPSPNWYLCNNRFLVHGFFNYRYLILKKTSEADGEKTYLGVPGVYEKPEMVMATLFGFPEFQTLPKEVSAAKMEEIISIDKEDKKSQEPKIGTFGCWLIPVQY